MWKNIIRKYWRRSKMRNLNKKIKGAEDFRYKELVKSTTALRRGINNIPNDKQWAALELVAREILQPVRNEFGRTRITSGFRSVELCLAVGSNKNSNHARGEAVDIEPMVHGVTLFDVFEFIHDNLDYRELVAEHFPAGWIHIGYRRGGNIERLKLKDSRHDYTDTTIYEVKRLYG